MIHNQIDHDRAWVLWNEQLVVRGFENMCLLETSQSKAPHSKKIGTILAYLGGLSGSQPFLFALEWMAVCSSGSLHDHHGNIHATLRDDCLAEYLPVLADVLPR